MDPIVLKIELNHDHATKLDRAKDAEFLRKCRSWFDLMGSTGQTAIMEFGEEGVTLTCTTSKGVSQDSCGYDSVLAVTEMKDGILLRFSHKRLVFLPVTADPQNNQKLMEIMGLLCRKTKYVFKDAALKLPGVPLGEKLRYYTAKRGHHTGSGYLKWFMVALTVVALFIGTMFVCQPIQNQKVSLQEAEELTAQLKCVAHTSNRYGSINEIVLYFHDADSQYVRSCCLGNGLTEKLENLPAGTNMHLLIHPQSGNVIQIEANGETLLESDYAQKKLLEEAWGFFGLGLFMYLSAGVMIVVLIRKKY